MELSNKNAFFYLLLQVMSLYTPNRNIQTPKQTPDHYPLDSNLCLKTEIELKMQI